MEGMWGALKYGKMIINLKEVSITGKSSVCFLPIFFTSYLDTMLSHFFYKCSSTFLSLGVFLKSGVQDIAQ